MAVVFDLTEKGESFERGREGKDVGDEWAAAGVDVEGEVNEGWAGEWDEVSGVVEILPLPEPAEAEGPEVHQ